jgi:hypothetical protein
MGLQYLSERLSMYLAESGESSHGIIIIDKRVGRLDYQVALSHMSFIFGHDSGRDLTNILEAPLFADSRLTMGLQLVDNISSLIYSNHYQYYCRDIDGASDYSHVQQFWPRLDALQYKSKCTLSTGQLCYGFRVVDLKKPTESKTNKRIGG